MGSVLDLPLIKIIYAFEICRKGFKRVIKTGFVVYLVTIEMSQHIAYGPPFTARSFFPILWTQRIEKNIQSGNLVIQRGKRIGFR